jgi:beta-1,4-N-acetylglucosaminyltransferase
MRMKAPRDPGTRRGSALGEEVDILLVCSSGGHLLQLLSLREAWKGFRTVWITFDKSDARSLLREERIFFAYGPTNRSLKNLGRNLVLAWRLIDRLRPRVILTTGAGVAVPFAWIGRLRGARVVYVESFTRIESPSLSCRLIAPVADRIYAQWPELRQSVQRARYVGNVFTPG